jgi:hypothetical protein
LQLGEAAAARKGAVPKFQQTNKHTACSG